MKVQHSGKNVEAPKHKQVYQHNTSWQESNTWSWRQTGKPKWTRKPKKRNLQSTNLIVLQFEHFAFSWFLSMLSLQISQFTSFALLSLALFLFSPMPLPFAVIFPPRASLVFLFAAVFLCSHQTVVYQDLFKLTAKFGHFVKSLLLHASSFAPLLRWVMSVSLQLRDEKKDWSWELSKMTNRRKVQTESNVPTNVDNPWTIFFPFSSEVQLEKKVKRKRRENWSRNTVTNIMLSSFARLKTTWCYQPQPPPPPPNTIKTANEGRFRLNVDSPYGERAQSTVLYGIQDR